LKHNSAEDWAQFLVEGVFLDLAGFPTVLRSDRGKEFTNQVVAAVNKRLGIKHVFGSAYHPQSQGYVEGRHQVINRILRTYCADNPSQWARFAKLAQWSMRATARADRNGKSPYEIITGLRPQGPLEDVFSKMSPNTLTPSEYVDELCKYTTKIQGQVHAQLEAEFDKREESYKRGSRTNKLPSVGDLVFIRREPYMKYYEADKKKQDQMFISRRLQRYADPKLYRVRKETTFGSYVLMDPDTKEDVTGGPFPPERLICLEDCPFEEPLNKDEPLWIKIRFNYKGCPDR